MIYIASRVVLVIFLFFLTIKEATVHQKQSSLYNPHI